MYGKIKLNKNKRAKGDPTMTLTINTNIASIIAERNLNNATNNLNRSLERLSTGSKINHASDNAAGYSIAKSWEAKLGSLDVAADNAATGADMLSTLEDHYALISTHIQRVRDLTEQAANGTYGSQSKLAIKEEIRARLDEVNRIAANCEFSGQYLMDESMGTTYLQVGLDSDVSKSGIKLDGSLFKKGDIQALFTCATADKDITVKSSQVYTPKTAATLTAAEKGTETDADKLKAIATELALDKLATECAGLGSKAEGSTDKTAAQMLEIVDNVINRISSRVTTLGAAQNRVESAIESINVQSENILSSLSTLRDADVAEESSNYLKAQILQQASATLLATANQQPSIALNLL